VTAEQPVTADTTVLILAGTAEGRELAGRLTDRGLRVISALAGRTPEQLPRPGDLRIGGFGGAGAMTAWLGQHRVAAVVDATHPFAQSISTQATEACAQSGTPLIRLQRPPYAAVPGDDWHYTSSASAAAALLPPLGRRAFLTTGQHGLAAFAAVGQVWFLIRCRTPPDGPLPAAREVLVDPGPYRADNELGLMKRHRIDVLVTKDSGGELTAGKLVAARSLGIPVVLISRPPPAGPACPSLAAAEACLLALLDSVR
jgi:precorrin-6A/cobalt-precorrin-6A reductase